MTSSCHPSPGEFRTAAGRLEQCLATLLARLDAADADSWEPGFFRRLRAAIRAVQLDLEADLYSGSSFATASKRLGTLGAELSLQEWTGVMPGDPEYGAALISARHAVEGFRAQLAYR